MIKRKDKIMIAALELLEEGGINHITTKRLAEKQGISEPALYRQYKNKNEIILSIIDEYSSYDQRIINTIKEENMDGLTALEFYINRFAELYQNYSELSTIYLSFDLFYYDLEAKEKMIRIIDNRVSFLNEWLTLHPPENCSYDAKTLSILINDLLQSEVKRWKISGKNYNLVQTSSEYIKTILKI